MERIRLHAEPRTLLGKKVRRLRREGKLPAVIYGAGLEPTPIQLDYKSAFKALRKVGSSTLIEIELGDTVHTTIMRERQRDVVTGRWLHVDFQAVSLTEVVEAEVPIVLEGEAPAAKVYNATILQQLETLTVEALPNDLPEQVVVDLSRLEKVGDVITVGDLVLSDKIKVLDPADEVVVAAVGEMGEEEIPAEAPEIGEPEIIEKGKKEEEEA